MFKKIAIVSAAAALFSIGQSASAGQTTNNMTVTATVAANCVVSTAPSNYTGSYDPVSANASASLDFTQSIAFKCTKSSTGVSVGVTQSANYGLGPLGASYRALKDSGTNYLSYDLFRPTAVGTGSCAYTAAYGTTVGTNTFGVGSGSFTSASSAVTVEICGRIPGGQDVPATGNYSDTVVVQVNF